MPVRSSGKPSRWPKDRTGFFLATFNVSLLTTAVCIVLGYPLAYVRSQLPRRAANLCLIAVMLPFWTSLLVRTYAWRRAAAAAGPCQHLGDATRPVGRAAGAGTQPFRHADRHGAHHAALSRAAGAGHDARDRPGLRQGGGEPRRESHRAFWTVFFPLSLPGLFPGALIVFIICLGFYVTPAVLGGGKVIMVSNQIASDIELFFNWGAASSLGVVLLILTLLFLYVASRLTRPEHVLGEGGR